MLTKPFSDHLNWLLNQKTGSKSEIQSVKSVTGGSINNAYKLETHSGNYFLKTNSLSRYPEMFNSEATGLELLRKTKSVSVPQTICAGEFENTSFLILEFITPGKRKTDYFEKLGSELAALHKNTSELFGLEHVNYIGSLKQSNRQNKNGVEFMINERFEPLIKLAYEKTLIENSHLKLFKKFCKILPGILPNEKPSLLHGDLWNGNVITGNSGSALMIDPAVYFGYRETDIAMTRLFGGFDDAFYASYNDTFPLTENWERRVELFQLYPLMVHLNLFGISYKNNVVEILKKYK